jgi:iron complex outermembrane receptor protein
MKKIFVLLLLIRSIYTVAQDNQELSIQSLDSVQISGYAGQHSIRSIPKTIHLIKLKNVQNQVVESIDDVLTLIAGADIRSRGSKGVQSDISIRGGNFDQVLVLLNGIKINNPQTGHHNLDIPVDVSMLDKIEILEGPAGQTFGVNSYSGVINLITKNPQKEQATVRLKIGQFGYLKTDYDIAHSFDKISVYNGFSYQKSNGYLSNDSINNTDFYAIKDLLTIRIDTKKNPINIQAGYHQKDFGANSFYTSKYPWQYEKTYGYFASVNTSFGKQLKWQPHLSYKQHFDQFQLFRESVYKYQNGFFVHKQDTAQFAPGFYYKGHNFHKTRILSAGVKLKFKSKFGTSNLNINLSDEHIFSNVLGELLDNPDGIYTKSAERTYLTSTFNQVKKIGDVNLGAGITMLYNKVYDFNFTGGIYANLVKKQFTHYLSVNSAVRLPSFTDLYYQGPSNIGNPDLKPEKSVTYELGSKYKYNDLRMSANVFYRNGSNTIDWIKDNPEDQWQTQNLTELNTYGAEFMFEKKFKNLFIKQLSLSYAYINAEKTQQNFISKYALDYLKHKMVASITHQSLAGIQANWTVTYKDRNGQYLDYVNAHYQLFDYKAYWLCNLKLSKNYKNTRFALSVENLFDVSYNDLSFIKMPGRWFIAELVYKVK